MARQANKPTEEPAAAPAPGNYFSSGAPGRGWLYGLLAAVILIIVFLAGAAAANHRHRGMVFKTANMMGGPGGEFGLGRHRLGGGFGGNVTINGQTRVSGVVTSVNGNNFTVAGHGSTTNVTTNSSTQYQDGNQVKQNDSVIVWGTDSSGTLSASQIVINP